jgi:hypothetical protein
LAVFRGMVAEASVEGGKGMRAGSCGGSKRVSHVTESSC